ncbi:MAG: hypothetical protein WAV27_01270 [Xanthobacteraceae bacterium]
MARSGIAVMSASCLLALAATLGGAEAQTAGAPLPLLQIDHAKTDHAKPAAHAHHPAPARIARTKSAAKAEHRRIAKGVHAKTRVADAGRDLPAPPATPPQKTPQSNSQSVWPTSPTAALGYAGAPKTPDVSAAALAPSAAHAPVTTEQVVDTDPNGILNGGHAVPAAMPTPVKPTASAAKAQPAAAKSATTKPSPPVKVAAATPAAPKSPVHAMLFRPSAPSAVGSASWIAQLLAALGGAIAAGAVAWFLIRPAPERTYG